MAKIDLVARLHGDNLREEVASRECEILDDEMEPVFSVLDARDGIGDVADLVHEHGKDRLSKSVPQFRLEFEGALVVEEGILQQANLVLDETRIQLVVTRGLEPHTDGAEKAIEVSIVFVVVRSSRPRVSRLSSSTKPGLISTLRRYLSTCLNQLRSPSLWSASSYSFWALSVIIENGLLCPIRSRRVRDSVIACLRA
jgi:hypothetical protein